MIFVLLLIILIILLVNTDKEKNKKNWFNKHIDSKSLYIENKELWGINKLDLSKTAKKKKKAGKCAGAVDPPPNSKADAGASGDNGVIVWVIQKPTVIQKLLISCITGWERTWPKKYMNMKEKKKKGNKKEQKKYEQKSLSLNAKELNPN